jgi:hypothetical protein
MTLAKWHLRVALLDTSFDAFSQEVGEPCSRGLSDIHGKKEIREVADGMDTLD